ncbi:MAG TPA: DUF6519 domain-containing protein, partial [Candidatus Deferrimicrobium sp.]|nr:DUF6519 domain-containing protein [Candidatus Deferrimicrobium sp.]
MSGDYSRQRFDVKHDFTGVLMQQGRVQLDADWNELVAILDRRLRAETTDIIGKSTVPKETPEGFRIQLAAGVLTIGRGRIYVDGLLAENHGKAPMEFDPILAEQRGTLALPYNEQPYFPEVASAAPAPTAGGPHLVYLDVWQREVTYLQDPNLVETAVGVDTTTRLQTVWQVRVLANVGAGVTCGAALPAWDSLIAPSAGRLSSKAVGVATASDPCLIPPSGGYRGLDNRLYRVEIHSAGAGGAGGTATFKWSRDNASVASAVTAITALDKLTVASLGRDSVMHFRIGDWLEITDDRRELGGQSGVMAQVKNVDDDNRIITLTAPLAAATFPTDAQGNTTPAHHTRVRRWDQSGQVRDSNGVLIVDLNAPGSQGVIPLPASGTSIVLEDGVQITFDGASGGNHHVGDYWNFAARTADASVQELNAEPPRGTHHHFARLALVTFPATVSDCRTLWPPEFGDESCECTVCVSAAAHNQGTLTIQRAIDQVKAAGGGTVCLGVGVYNLGEAPLPINIDGLRSLTIRGQGAETQLNYLGRGPAITVQNSAGVTIEKLALASAAAEGDAMPAILLTNSGSVTLQRCAVLRLGSEATNSAAIGMAGILLSTTIRENLLVAPIGIGNLIKATAAGIAVAAQQSEPLITLALDIRDNGLFCGRRGVSFVGLALHALTTRVSGNFFSDCAQAGIAMLGYVPAGYSVEISANELRINGIGIAIGTDGTRVTENSITSVRARGANDGILVAPGLDKTGIDQCHIIGNRVTAVGGHGVHLRAPVNSAMIKNNFIEDVGLGGIVMGEEASAQNLCVENNQIRDVVGEPNSDKAAALIGIRLVDSKNGEVVNNSIIGVGLRAPNQRPVAIQLIGCEAVRVAGNSALDIGPVEGNHTGAGIESVGTFDRLQIVGNTVRRSQTQTKLIDGAQWYAVVISGARTVPPRLRAFTNFFAAKSNTSFILSDVKVIARPLGRELVSLHDNHFDAYGAAQAVLIAISGACTFNDNRCLLLAL